MSAKVLFLDIETAPVLASVWKLFDENIGLNQIDRDWFILSWAAKWQDKKEILYMDQRKEKKIEDDSRIVKEMWNLLDEADVVITQNGVRFDIKKLNARFILNGLQPPSSYRLVDTYKIAKQKFGFTSNKLEYMVSKLCPELKKYDHKKFPGFELWKQCLLRNKEAFYEMEKYNKHDVVCLEAVFKKLDPWAKTYNVDIYHDGLRNVCSCGGLEWKLNGTTLLESGKYQRYKCLSCGKEKRGRQNLLAKDKKQSLLIG